MPLRGPAPASPRTPSGADVLDRAATLCEALEEVVGRDPQRECLILLDGRGGEVRLSRGQFWRRAGDVGATLQERGLRPGDSVVLIVPTGADLVSAYFGAMLAGGVPTLLSTPGNRVSDPRLYLDRVGGVLENADARIVYAEADTAALLRGSGSERLGHVGVVEPQEVREAGSRPDHRAAPEDIATIQYSSGTTGAPKGVMLPHRAILHHLRALRDGLEIGAEDVHVNWIPLYHDMGLFGCFVLPLLCGCKTVLIPTFEFLRRPMLWLEAIHAHRGAVSWAPNFSYSFCAKRIPDEELRGLDLSSWRLAMSGSEPVLAHTVEVFTRRFAPHGFAPEAMTPTWGLAEATMAATAHPVREPPRVETLDRAVLAREGRAVATRGEGVSVVATGRCLPGYELEIRDGSGRPLPERHVGDVWLRSAALFAGYRKDPEQSAACVSDGWFRTGDQGYTSEGDLFFVARSKDLIVIGGEKYAPTDVENVLAHVEGLREGCAVAFGVVSEVHGTEELAVVAETRVPQAQQAALAREIRARVRSTLGLQLRYLKLVPPGGIEKTTSGKLARTPTRERYRAELRS